MIILQKSLTLQIVTSRNISLVTNGIDSVRTKLLIAHNWVWRSEFDPCAKSSWLHRHWWWMHPWMLEKKCVGESPMVTALKCWGPFCSPTVKNVTNINVIIKSFTIQNQNLNLTRGQFCSRFEERLFEANKTRDTQFLQKFFWTKMRVHCTK